MNATAIPLYTERNSEAAFRAVEAANGLKVQAAETNTVRHQRSHNPLAYSGSTTYGTSEQPTAAARGAQNQMQDLMAFVTRCWF